MKLPFVLLALLFVMPLAAAQEGGSLDWDLADIFYEPPPPPPAQEEEGFSPLDLLRQPGLTFDGTFEFVTGIVPGWDRTPWYGANEDDFSWGYALRAQFRFDLDAQFSDILRVRSALFFTLPGYQVELREFFFDYTLFDRFFFRGGRFNQSWGSSPNFAFTNLLARVPDDTYTDDPFILRMDMPVGIGGFQFLAMTRRDLLDGDSITPRDIGYGLRFNLALQWMDMNVGTFYQEQMPLRGFLSFNTTIGRTEWYNEWLGAIDLENQNTVRGAANIGFVRDFFRNRLTVNGELFYNAERGTYWYSPETSIREAQSIPLNEGFNIALNLFYRLGGARGPRLFVQSHYNPEQRTAQLVPGLRLTPWEHLEFYFAVPMVLGDRSGHFYLNTADPIYNRPFAIVMLVTLRGTVRIGQN